MGMAGHTGLGNPSPPLMNNEGKVSLRMLTEAMELFFKGEPIDYQIKDDGILIGFEPAYQYEHLRVIFIAKDKAKSYIENGVAWGSYGSGIASTRKYYREFKYKSKFVKFIDKWNEAINKRLIK